MTIQICDDIFWVGKQDWSLREFHGSEYHTPRGSSYNSYLIKGEKNVLIDTVWKPYSQEFINNLQQTIDLNKIDCIVMNHAEIDHSGALPALMALIPDTPIYCSNNATRSLKGHFHQDWNFIPVKTGATIDLGNGKILTFITAQMLHWPDSMMCHLSGNNILFSNDAFGQHYASEQLFDNQNNNYELMDEARKYFVNILAPYRQLVMKKINELKNINPPIQMICPSHGTIWRHNPEKIIANYELWSSSDYRENQITLVYETMWESTRVMAESIAQGIHQADPNITIKIFHLAAADKTEVITEIFKSKGVLIGSPTVNNVMLPGIAGLLEELQGLKFDSRLAAAFGSHGWSGVAIDRVSTRLQECGFLTIDGLKMQWCPTVEMLEQCKAYGQSFVEHLGN